jgi:hypothetical protein
VSLYLANSFGAIRRPHLPLQRIRVNEISRRRLAKNVTFYLSIEPKKRLGGCRLIDYNLLFVVNHLDHQEHDLREFKKEMFHVVASPFLFVFCLLHRQKCDSGDVEKPMIPVFPTHCNVIF